jgi:hypothetical protein
MLIAASGTAGNTATIALSGVSYLVSFGGAAGMTQAYVAGPLGRALANAGPATIVDEAGEPAADNWSLGRYSAWCVPLYPMSPF